MSFKVGQHYLVPDPDQDSAKVADIRRIWLPRVSVELVWKSHNPFRARRRYLVRTADGREFYTGRLERPKKITKTTGQGDQEEDQGA
jgi:hypothetical protein